MTRPLLHRLGLCWGLQPLEVRHWFVIESRVALRGCMSLSTMIDCSRLLWTRQWVAWEVRAGSLASVLDSDDSDDL